MRSNQGGENRCIAKAFIKEAVMTGEKYSSKEQQEVTAWNNSMEEQQGRTAGKNGRRTATLPLHSQRIIQSIITQEIKTSQSQFGGFLTQAVSSGLFHLSSPVPKFPLSPLTQCATSQYFGFGILTASSPNLCTWSTHISSVHNL